MPSLRGLLGSIRRSVTTVFGTVFVAGFWGALAVIAVRMNTGTGRPFRTLGSRRMNVSRVVFKVLPFLLCGSGFAQFLDTMDFIPPNPSTFLPFTVRMHGFLPNSPSPGIVPSRTTVSGNTFRIEGCVPSYGFATPSDYTLLVSVGPLAPGTYTIEHYTSHYCASDPITSSLPPRFRISRQVFVTADGAGAAIPTLNPWFVLLLALLMSVFAYVAYQRR